MTRPGNVPSRSTLQRLPGRVLLFLQAIGTQPALRATMAKGGYGPGDHAEGARLLGAVCAYGTSSAAGQDADAQARQAAQQIRDWVSAHFARLRAALQRLHPGAESLFAGFEAPEPHQAVLAVGALLERLASCAPEVKETLAQRGLDSGERSRLAELVASAQSASVQQLDCTERERRTEQLLALHRWYTDWTTTARALVGRKRWLIALGLASRKRDEDEAAS
jgi:hypothetical protein